MGFLAVILATTLDPIGLIGYIASGVANKTMGWALAIAAGWAVAMEGLVRILNASYGPDFNGRVFLARLIGALIVTSLTFWVASAVRKKKAKASQYKYTPKN